MTLRKLDDEDLGKVAGGGDEQVLERQQEVEPSDPRTKRPPGDTVRLPSDKTRLIPVEKN